MVVSSRLPCCLGRQHLRNSMPTALCTPPRLAASRLPHRHALTLIHSSKLGSCTSQLHRGTPFQLPSHNPTALQRQNLVATGSKRFHHTTRCSSEEGSTSSSTTNNNTSGGSSSSSTTPSTQKSNNKNETTPATTNNRRSNNRNNKTPTGRWAWFTKLTSNTKLHNPIRFIFNMLALFLIMRFWPIPGSKNPAVGNQEAITVNIAFSEFIKQVRRNEISRVVIDGNTFSYVLKPHSEMYKMLPDSLEKSRIGFSTTRPTDYPTPYSLLESNGIQFSAVDKGGAAAGFSSLLTYGFWLIVIVALLNRLPLKLPGRSGTGRKHNNNNNTTQNIVKFDDVAGVDEAKEELKEVVDYLRDPEKFSKLGARPPSGVLLVGPPGTGKTLLARAVAGEADAPFFSISASEFIELYVGMGAMRVRELFAQARKEAPAIVFIDEIDAVAKGRDTKLRSVGNDEREQTLNQLLTELDGFDSHRDQLVICIAATNRPDVLDAALLRPGRFDRRVLVERPDKKGREEILQVHITNRELPLGTDVSVESLAAQTTGFTGADLANLVNEAALLAGRYNKSTVEAVDFDAAILRAVAGVEKKRSVLQGVEKQCVARHEAGHALVSTAVAALVPGSATVEKLSIVPRSGGALGFTYLPPKTEDRALMFVPEIRGQLAMLMGGRAAEALTCDSISTGASDDIRRATDLAHKAVTQFGLSDAVGPLNVDVLEGGGEDYAFLRDGAGTMARLVEREVKNLCDGALAVAADVITANKKLHERLSYDLEIKERMDRVELEGMLCEVVVPASLKEFVLGGGAATRQRLLAGFGGTPPPPPLSE